MVSRAAWIAQRHCAIHGEPCSSGREAKVAAAGQHELRRLATALELRRSTNQATKHR
jgi:hypothetical protein